MFPSRTISVQIGKPIDEVYAFAHLPENFMKWASGLATTLHREGEVWAADTPEGKATVRFSEKNQYGVLDHWVRCQRDKKSTFRFASSLGTRNVRSD